MLGRVLSLAAATLLYGCASIQLDVATPPSYAIEQWQDTTLGRNFAAQLASAPGASGLRLLISGQEAFAARAALAEAAQRSLDLQYHIVAHDTTSTQLLYRALRAANRGVRVRLLIDDVNPELRDSDLANLALHPNVEVRLFNPFAIRDPSSLSRILELLGNGERLKRRMHNKLWIVDNAVVVMGGRNLADAYFDATPSSNFADLDVLVAGQVVPEISRGFDQYWNSEWAVPIQALRDTPASAAEADRALTEMAARAEQFRAGDYARSLRETELGRMVRTGQLALITAKATALHDLPGESRTDVPAKTGTIFPAMHQLVEQASEEVIMISPYLVPGERGLDAICRLTRRGVRVRVLTNSLASTDVPVVHAAYARYRPALLDCGVELYELRPADASSWRTRVGFSSGGSLHAKAIVVDRKLLFLGSMNLDPRSKRLNTEVALQVESAAVGDQLGRLFDESTAFEHAFRVELDEPGNPAAALHWTSSEDGQPVRYACEPLVSVWYRIFTSVIGGVIPEELL